MWEKKRSFIKNKWKILKSILIDEQFYVLCIVFTRVKFLVGRLWIKKEYYKGVTEGITDVKVDTS